MCNPPFMAADTTAGCSGGKADRRLRGTMSQKMLLMSKLPALSFGEDELPEVESDRIRAVPSGKFTLTSVAGIQLLVSLTSTDACIPSPLAEPTAEAWLLSHE